jgi:ribosome-associated protein
MLARAVTTAATFGFRVHPPVRHLHVATRALRPAGSRPRSRAHCASSLLAVSSHRGECGGDTRRHRQRRSHDEPRGSRTLCAATYSSKRLRASDEFVEEKENDFDEDYDPYVHMGRPNKTAIKKLMLEYKELTKVLCELPRSSLAKITMPDELREEIYATAKITAHIARKRSEGKISKLLRIMDDEDVLPIQLAVENLQAGVGLLTVSPEVEATATGWRDRLLSGDADVQSEVFGLMSRRESWRFTRQELGQLVTRAKKERAEAEKARREAEEEAAAAAAEATMLQDGSLVPTANEGGWTGGKKKKKAGKATKQLLKHLRDIAQVADA